MPTVTHNSRDLAHGVEWMRPVEARPELHNNVGAIARLAKVFEGYFDTFQVGAYTLSYSSNTRTYFRGLYVAAEHAFSTSYLVVNSVLRLNPIKLYTGKFSFLSLLDEHFFDKADRNHILKDISHEASYNRYNRVNAVQIVLPVALPAQAGAKEFTVAYYLDSMRSLLTTNWSNNELTVEFVDAHIRDDIIQQLGLRKQSNRVRLVQPIRVTIGCDPEFEVKNSAGSIVSATTLVGLEGTGARVKIGRDGQSQQVELRPSPGTPEEVVADLENLFALFRQRYPQVKLCVSGHTYPLGGHIHIGLGNREKTPSSQLLTILNDFIGAPTLPLSGRARGGYAQLGAQRSKRWGFEYRTPPAMIFYNPTLTRIVLKLAYNLVNRYINVKKSIQYSTPVEYNDLVTVGGLSSNEARYYLNKLKTLKSRLESNLPIEAKWLEDDEQVNLTLNIQFSGDEWGDPIRTDITRRLTDAVKPSIPTALHLFGYRSDRGLVSNIDIEGMENLAQAFVVAADSSGIAIKVGLPYLFRTNAVTYSRHILAVVRAIKKCVEKASQQETEERRHQRIEIHSPVIAFNTQRIEAEEDSDFVPTAEIIE